MAKGNEKLPRMHPDIEKHWEAGLAAFEKFYERDKWTMLDDDERDDSDLYDLLLDVFMTGWTAHITHTNEEG